ncbi:hypothetical protein [Pyrococcus kukulkanii]|uniref:hypothetical protein n=1 Tax=Pyrococcus kukulkanii TaxID=1609559 RepID=UPI000831A437|nr:hypothetical protein [Pyrococcus kukulkanii]
MRKKERLYVTFGLVLIFAAIAWYAYNGFHGGGFVDLSNILKNSTNETESYKLAISDLSASVDQETGHVIVSFKLANEEHFNISSVQVLYALNVADPKNATYQELNANKDNETYKAEIPSAFGDLVYYKVKVTYDGNKTLESDVKSITVKDTTAPTIQNITVSYNATDGNVTFTIAALDNDALDKVILYYAINPTENTTFSNITLTVSPYEVRIPVSQNDTIVFYVEAIDLSGNKARLPGEGYYEFLANETKELVFQEG